MEDRRSSKRAPTILEGRIRIDEQAPYIECTVRNVSESGAQIWTHAPLDLPSEFAFDIPKRGYSSRARIMWSSGRSHGVMFLQDLSGDASLSTNSDRTIAADANPQVRSILDDARDRLAQIMNVPVAAVRLNLDIDRS